MIAAMAGTQLRVSPGMESKQLYRSSNGTVSVGWRKARCRGAKPNLR